ncbi:MAG TPA: thiamine-phosphate kinase [Polyangiales bacterium]
MSTEHERIARIRALFSRPNAAISLGIGDDCAVLAEAPGLRVWTVDAAIEHIHFSRDFMRNEQVGFRAFMAAASDVAAMGAEPLAALCALAFPKSFDDAALDALLTGIAEAADRLGLPVVGGNLARAGELSITTTVLGSAQRAITRAGALVGHGVFVSGTLGGAALGLAALRAGHTDDAQFTPAIERFLRPQARFDLVSALRRHASAAIDVSDGLVQDLEHLCEASGLGAEIEIERVPRLVGFDRLAAALGHDPRALLLAGGEDYELLFTAPSGAVPPSLGTRIGVMRGAAGVRVTSASGEEWRPPPGFDHFR